MSVETINVYLNPTIRADLEAIVEPLKKEGIDSFRLASPLGVETVRRDEADYFTAPSEQDELLQDREAEEIVEVLSPHFSVGHKWQFALAGGGEFWAAILDRRFLERVAAHEVSFGRGDALRVRMRTRITRNAKGAFDRFREILEVLEIIPPVRPLGLFDQP